MITVDATGAYAKLRAVSESVNERQLLTEIGNRLLRWVNDQFRTEGAQGGRPWRALSPNTVAGRRGGSSRILQNTGALRSSFAFRILGSAVEVGTASKIAAFHQFGTRPYEIRPRTAKALRFAVPGGFRFSKIVHHPGLPARPMIPDDQQGGELALDVINTRIYNAIRRAA